MSRGLGRYQRRIMEALTADSPSGTFYWSIQELSERCDGSPRQTITACRSLEARGLVVVGRGAVRWVEAEPGFPLRMLERPVPGLLVADRERDDAEAARTKKLLAGI
ncbi:hypothetical protein ACQ3I4_11190 [Zafaria sp. Z1313]|uniref:hypothetical protein n=1 Tax=Zafaria sp. Z1313 TaxID=3423202 RepID=UPI003D302C65